METTQITASYEEALLFVKNSVVEAGKEVYDKEHEIGELMMANVRPDGHCAWGERDT